MLSSLGYTKIIRSEWAQLHELQSSNQHVIVDGQTLSLASVIAVSTGKARAIVTQDQSIRHAIDESVDFLNNETNAGRVIYGVNTGFGGSADVRTNEVHNLQAGLVQHLNVGILLPSDKGITDLREPSEPMLAWRNHALPVSVVRGMMLIRCNSLMRGHSGVRIQVVEQILTLLAHDITPIVPLRGSISASGDLSPLSYIAGAIEGNPGIYVRIGGKSKSAIHTTADKALKLAGIESIRLQAKEGLGITNGTATSTAAACLAMHQGNQLALLTQILTAMATEALLGTAHNFDPFISQARPHPGQAEAAANILSFLSGSSLAPYKDASQVGLAQDRYPLRTAPQWIGPQLENLQLSLQQVQVEINSTTDNPLIDVARGMIHHGGNFQAVAITSAMEKVSSSLQMLGKIVYQQCSELLNNHMNKGLPPNLCMDDPSKSFTMKGLDVNMAAYMSELAHLAHPVSAHIQSAEMNNQSVNSLALVAARSALESVELLSLMFGTYVYVLCQALDLRALHIEFVRAAEPKIHACIRESFAKFVSNENMDSLCSQTWSDIVKRWLDTTTYDLADRGPKVAEEACSPLLLTLAQHCLGFQTTSNISSVDLFKTMTSFRSCVAQILIEEYDSTREAFLKQPTTGKYLGTASRVVYEFVRQDLDIPIHRGLEACPSISAERQDGSGKPNKTLGTLASDIYISIRNGRLQQRVMEMLQQSEVVPEKEKALSTPPVAASVPTVSFAAVQSSCSAEVKTTRRRRNTFVCISR